jgi:hypothetical protein
VERDASIRHLGDDTLLPNLTLRPSRYSSHRRSFVAAGPSRHDGDVSSGRRGAFPVSMTLCSSCGPGLVSRADTHTMPAQISE